jgi:site-specific DNA-methyltransferase (adenine-specific)
MINKGMMSSNTAEWATPQWLFDLLNDEFNFDLDVCSTDENAKCKNHYTEEDDGLSKPWKAMSGVILLMEEILLNW